MSGIKIRKLGLPEIAEIYKLLKPYNLHGVTYEDLLLDMFRKDVYAINKLFELLTYSKSEKVEGLIILQIIPKALIDNNFGAFVALMKGGSDGSKS